MNRQVIHFYYLGENSLYGQKYATKQETKIDTRRDEQTPEAVSEFQWPTR